MHEGPEKSPVRMSHHRAAKGLAAESSAGNHIALFHPALRVSMGIC